METSGLRRTKIRQYSVVVIGVSTGGMKALQEIIPNLPADLPFSIIIVIHRSPDGDDYLEKSLDDRSRLSVKQAEDKEEILPGTVYIAPPNYHLLIEDDRCLSLSVDCHVNFARPSVDVLFESAAAVYGSELAGIILTGANYDGSNGLKIIQKYGGLVAVQDPRTAEVQTMPLAAIAAVHEPIILPLREIAPFLASLATIQATK